ncbi:MAG: hypothetical protein QNL43_06925 [Crocinitomicaceae bacterium]|jgi:hypothetical protein|tara:strand:+ start:458 stop:1954 length:1497 start_codon:yes stop_codon:yes gene_type:complete
MDLIKEIVLTFSESDKKEFEQFLTRKRPGAKRKDVEVFRYLYLVYNGIKTSKNELSGDQNYHAVRKRISKELTHFLILKKSISEQNVHKREAMVLMILYFIERNKYNVAWELLNKEERNAERVKNIDLNLKIQRLKLTILPYFNQEKFPAIKKKMMELQLRISKIDEFQLYFIQVKNDLKLKIAQGSVASPSEIIKNALAQYNNIKSEYNNPVIHLKVIEIIRAEYILNRKFKVFAEVAQKYYNDFLPEIFKSDSHINTFAQIEYIMSYTFLNAREFKKSLHHLSKLEGLMSQSQIVKDNFQGKHVAIASFIKVFDHQIHDAIQSIESFLLNEVKKISVQEYLNLSLNLAGYLIIVRDYSKAAKIFNFMSEPNSYYQKEMGREWLIRKEMILCIVQTSLGNTEFSLKILSSIEKKHTEMLKIEQYSMVNHFIRLIRNFIHKPHEANLNDLIQFEKSIELNKEKVFRDPRLIIFYAWLRSQYVNKDAYEILIEEYQQIS